MRELKFRAWVLSPSGNQHYMLSPEQTSIDFDALNQNDDCILMQYTGLQDFKGVDIFEGDIVKMTDGYPSSTHLEVVEFKRDRFWNVLPYDSGGATTVYPSVIGNIYENPELLEGK